MPMIDVYAAAGTFRDPPHVRQRPRGGGDALGTGARVAAVQEQHCCVHPRPRSNRDLQRRGGQQLRSRPGAHSIWVLDREKQLGVVEELTEIVAAAAGDEDLRDRTWVLLTESPDGGWGIAGHANTNADIAALARAALDAR